MSFLSRLCCLTLIALLAAPLHAKDQLIPLTEDDGAALAGKRVALTRHDRPSFVAMTAGKATFALLGAGAMIAAGNKLVTDNSIADPADVVRDQLAKALAAQYRVEMLAADTSATNATKPAELASVHPEADYVLDVRSGGWNHSYFPTRWSAYWVGYSVQVQLIDTRTGRQVSNAACNANTQANPHAPSKEALYANNAQLLKDVTTALGWMCVQLLGKEQLRIAAENLPATPSAYLDPLADYARATPGAATAPTAAEPAQP